MKRKHVVNFLRKYKNLGWRAWVPTCFSHWVSRWQKKIGRNSHIDPSVQVLGWSGVRIQQNSCISESCCLNINFRSRGLSLDIGNHVFVGRRCFFSTGDLIQLGDYCLIGVDCHFLGAGHKMHDPTLPYLVAGVESYGKIILGANVWLSNQVTIVGDVQIGFGTVVGAQSVILKSLPPLSMAIGNPARIIKLYDLNQKQWIDVDEKQSDFTAVLERHLKSLMSPEDYLAALKQKQPYPRMAHIAAGFRAGEI